MPDNLRKVVIDGLTIETTDQGAQAIEKLQKQLNDAQSALEAANTAHASAIADKDKDLGAKDAEIAKLTSAQLDTAALDALVKDRAAVIDSAKSIAKDIQVDGLDNAAIRRAAVSAKLGSETIDGKSDDYVTGLFDHFAKDAAEPKDKVKDAVKGAPMSSFNANDGDAVAAHAAMVKGLTDAYKGASVGQGE